MGLDHLIREREEKAKRVGELWERVEGWMVGKERHFGKMLVMIFFRTWEGFRKFILQFD